MAKVASNWNFGPGLTSQLGPFKINKSDLPQVRKTPWKGGGVAGGGQQHAGHGNWIQVMNPQHIKSVPYPLAPSEYSKLVGPALPSTYYGQGTGIKQSRGKIIFS